MWKNNLGDHIPCQKKSRHFTYHGTEFWEDANQTQNNKMPKKKERILPLCWTLTIRLLRQITKD